MKFYSIECKEKLAKNYINVLCTILELKEQFDKLNQMLSICMFVKIFTNGIILSASLFIIMEQYISSMPDQVVMLLSVLDGGEVFLEVLICCWSSQAIINQMESLITAIEENITIKMIKEMGAELKLNKFYNSVDRTNVQEIKSIENTNDLKMADNIKCNCLQRIGAMKQSFCFTVLNMFSLHNTALLQFIGNVISYAILLIQTK